MIMMTSSILCFSQISKKKSIRQNTKEWSEKKDIRTFDRYEKDTAYGHYIKSVNAKFLIADDENSPIILYLQGKKIILKKLTLWETDEYGTKKCKIDFDGDYCNLIVYSDLISIDNGTERYRFYNH